MLYMLTDLNKFKRKLIKKRFEEIGKESVVPKGIRGAYN